MSELFRAKSNQATLLMIFANNKKSFEQPKIEYIYIYIKGQYNSWTRNESKIMRKLNQGIFFQTFATPIFHSYELF